MLREVTAVLRAAKKFLTNRNFLLLFPGLIFYAAAYVRAFGPWTIKWVALSLVVGIIAAIIREHLNTRNAPVPD